VMPHQSLATDIEMVAIEEALVGEEAEVEGS
jgi:hypothetical protein